MSESFTFDVVSEQRQNSGTATHADLEYVGICDDIRADREAA